MNACTQLLEGSSTNGRVITPLLDRFISHHIKRWQPNWVPQQICLPSIHQDLGKAAWLYPSLGKNWWISADLGEFWLRNQNLTHTGVFQTQLFHSNRSGQLFHPSGDSSKTTHKRSKASRCDPKMAVWSELTKLDLNPCFPQAAGSLLFCSLHKSLRENCTATFISTHPSDLTLVPASSFIMKRESSALSSSSSS